MIFSTKERETMKLKTLAAAAALAVMSLQAQAVTTYTFGFDGEQWDCSSICGFPGDQVSGPYDWSGTLALTAPDGDGTFTNDAFGNAPPILTLTLLNHLLRDYVFGPGYGGPLSAVVSGGQLVSLTGAMQPSHDFGTWTLEGTTMRFSSPAVYRSSPASYGTATLDLAAPIPEPETWALLLAGFGVMGTLARRRARQ
jgi:hypothetical protein